MGLLKLSVIAPHSKRPRVWFSLHNNEYVTKPVLLPHAYVSLVLCMLFKICKFLGISAYMVKFVLKSLCSELLT